MNDIHLDHLALASHHSWDNVSRYCHELGATWHGGPSLDDGGGFYFSQAGLAGGTTLEFLEPIPGEGSDFLRRFLDRNGPGPHHFTFKVADFDAAIDAVQAEGYDVVGIDRSDPGWQEGFLHPKQSHGIVIQLACPSDGNEGWDHNVSLPPAQRSSPPALPLVRHLVADLDAAVELFAGPLAMGLSDRGAVPEGRRARLTDGPWQLELIEPTNPEWLDWLGPRSGRLLDITLALADPATISGAKRRADGGFELAPEDNLGLRVILTELTSAERGIEAG